MLSRTAVIYALIATLFLMGVDQFSKNWGAENLLVHADATDTHLYQGSRRPIFLMGNPEQESSSSIEFQWNYVRNHGAAWGVLASMSEQERSVIFQWGTFGLCGLLTFLAFQKRWVMPRLSRVSILIIVGGAFSNLIDRVGLGYVVDVFDLRLQFGTWRYALPAFNLADAMIVAGLVMATIAEFLGIDSTNGT